MSYFEFINKINKSQIKIIFELGSRDLIDAIKLLNYYNCKVYAFECNPDCLIECNKNLLNLHNNTQEKICLIDKAVSLIDNDEVLFYPFDLSKYNNMGSSSMLKIDFSMRNKDDPDYNRENPQKEIKVKGIRLDTFMNENDIKHIDLLCIDLQGYELNAIKSLGTHLHQVKYIITECSIVNTYSGGASFTDLNNYLNNYNFIYSSSNRFGNNFPDLNLKGFSEFDALFINNSYLEI
jgi:FkbM family methyltransferase